MFICSAIQKRKNITKDNVLVRKFPQKNMFLWIVMIEPKNWEALLSTKNLIQLN